MQLLSRSMSLPHSKPSQKTFFTPLLGSTSLLSTIFGNDSLGQTIAMLRAICEDIDFLTSSLPTIYWNNALFQSNPTLFYSICSVHIVHCLDPHNNAASSQSICGNTALIYFYVNPALLLHLWDRCLVSLHLWVPCFVSYHLFGHCFVSLHLCERCLFSFHLWEQRLVSLHCKNDAMFHSIFENDA